MKHLCNVYLLSRVAAYNIHSQPSQKYCKRVTLNIILLYENKYRAVFKNCFSWFNIRLTFFHFSSVSWRYLNKCFKQLFGCLPSPSAICLMLSDSIGKVVIELFTPPGIQVKRREVCKLRVGLLLIVLHSWIVLRRIYIRAIQPPYEHWLHTFF